MCQLQDGAGSTGGIQAGMGWTDSHLHRFSLGGVFDRNAEQFLCPFDVEEGEDDDGTPEQDVRLDECLADPGDVLHYYVQATDSDGRVSTMPSDTSGFLDFDPTSLYVSAPMDAYATRVLAELPEVDGFLFKSRSPSCGPHDVKIYRGESPDATSRRGAGVFADAVAARHPGLPMEILLKVFGVCVELNIPFHPDEQNYHVYRQ